jgi:hypothetical protein
MHGENPGGRSTEKNPWFLYFGGPAVHLKRHVLMHLIFEYTPQKIKNGTPHFYFFGTRP